MLINSPNISGSLTVTGNATISGSLNVAGGINATITGSATSASYVEYSNVANKPTLVSGSSQVSFNGIVDKPTLVSGSSQVTYSGLTGIPTGIVSSSTQIAGYNLFATTGSNQFNGSQAITGSLTVTGSFNLNDSATNFNILGNQFGETYLISNNGNIVLHPVGDSEGIVIVKETDLTVEGDITVNNLYASNGVVSGSSQIVEYNIFATTGSNQFDGSQAITGSLIVTGQVVAQTLNVQQVTSSIVFSSGSNIFGNSLSNTQQFTGSVSVTGSLTTSIAAFGSAATTFLTSDSGTIKSRTAAQTLSDIAALPLAGGTLTGALNGTSASFTGAVQIVGSGNSEVDVLTISNFEQDDSGDETANIYFQLTRSYTNSLSPAGYIKVGKERAWSVSGGRQSFMSFLTRNGADDPTERMRITSSGNLGLGVTPSAWAINPAFQIKDGGSLWALNNQNLFLSQNVYFDGSFRYIASVPASSYQQSGGAHLWLTSPSGTAGDAITFTQAMTLGSNSGLSIGTPSAAPSQGLLVQGASNFNGNLTIFTAGYPYIDLGINSSNYWRIINDNPNDTFIIGKNGASNFILNSAGAATFSSSVQSANILVNTTTNDGFVSVNGNNSSRVFYAQGGGLFPSGNSLFRIDAGGNVVFQILGSGAATFSSSVTATTATLSGSASDRLIMTRTSVGTYHLAISATNRFSIYDPTADVERISITSGGNVGIGTTSPSNLLEVVGSTFAQIRASNFATSGINRGGGFRATSTTNGGTSFLGDLNAISDNSNAPYNGVDGVYLGSRTSGFPLGLTVNNAGTEILALNIVSTGAATFSSSVTAGGVITSDSATTAALPSTSGSTQSGGHRLRLTTNGTNTAVIDYGTAGGSGGWIQAAIKDSLGTNLPLLLNPNGGNVGIGTTNPTFKLEVAGVVRIQDTLSFTNGDSGQAIFTNNSTAVSVSTTTALGSAFAMGGSGAFVIVYGSQSTNVFIDTIIAANSGTPVVLSSTTVLGSPSARTYSTASNRLQLAMASGTYDVRINILRIT
jgi:hypothetical protein